MMYKNAFFNKIIKNKYMYVYAATQITLTLRHSHARQMGLALKKKGHHVITHRLIKSQIANMKITIENWKV